MQLRNTADRFGAVSQVFHWVIAGLIVVQYVLASLAEDAPLFQQLTMIARHKSFGILILGLAVLRLLWRLRGGPAPAAPPGPKWQHLAARASHVALYTLLFLQPLTGWLMSSARGFTVSVFNLFTIPDLVPVNQDLYNLLHETHEVLASLLFLIVVVHVLAALGHHFIHRNDVLRRMLPVRLKDSQS